MDVATKTELKDVPQQLDDATLASDDKKLASNDTSISSDLSASLQKNIKVLSRLFLYCPIIGLGLASFQVINPSHTCRAIIVQPNKVYIGGLPDDTRETDLRDCFGTFGPIKYIELKTGYGFVEFDARQAAEEAVAVYNEGMFLGNKIRVELSHGGGKSASKLSEPGACFKCGQHGHWARECPNHTLNFHQKRSPADRSVSQPYRRPDSHTESRLLASGPPDLAEQDEHHSHGRQRLGNYSKPFRGYNSRERDFGQRPNHHYDHPRKGGVVSHTSAVPELGHPPGRPRSPYGYSRYSDPSHPPRGHEGKLDRQISYDTGYLQSQSTSQYHNGASMRRPDPYPDHSQSFRSNQSYSSHPISRDPPRFSGRNPEYKNYDVYSRPYERRRSASPPRAYRDEGSSSHKVYSSGDDYPPTSYGRLQQSNSSPAYGLRASDTGQRHIPPPTSRTNRLSDREYRAYRA